MESPVSPDCHTSPPLWALALLAAVALLVFLPGNDVMPLLDRDEPRFAQATREMIQQGDWVIPYFNHEFRFDKPILIYWMMRASYAAFGVNEFAARLPSVLSAILLGWLVYLMGRKWFSPRAGFFAAFGLLTCVQLFIHARCAVADMPMLAMVALSHFAAWELLHTDDAPGRRRWFAMLYGSLGLGFLAKGPVALVVPLLTLLFFRFVFWRKPAPWGRLKIAPGLLISLALVGAWGIPALIRTAGEFWNVGMNSHVLKRGWSSFDGHGAFVLYYLLTAFFSLYPWIAFAGRSACLLRRRYDEKNAFLLSWLAGTYLLFSLYMTKLPHYVLPAFPAFFLILGQTVNNDMPWPRWTRIWFNITLFALPLFILLAVAVLFSAPVAGPWANLRWAAAGLVLVTLALTALALAWRSPQPSPWLVGIPLLSVGFAAALLGRGLRPVTPAVQLQSVFTRMPAETRFAFHRFREPSLVFYSNRRWETLNTFDDVQAFLDEPGPCMLVTLQQETRLDQFLAAALQHMTGRKAKSPGRDFSLELAALNLQGAKIRTIEGINSARASGVTLRVFTRD